MPEIQPQEAPLALLINRETSSEGLKTPGGVGSVQLRRAESRRIHAVRWVAWTPDDRDVAFVADTRQEIQEKVRSAGIEGLKLEVVPSATFR
jgi:hypothetical protein